MLRCPNCRAKEPGGPRCRRCDMELQHLLAIDAAVDRWVGLAVAFMRGGDMTAAQAPLRRAYGLRHDPFVAAMLGFSARSDIIELNGGEGPAVPSGTFSDGNMAPPQKPDRGH